MEYLKIFPTEPIFPHLEYYNLIVWLKYVVIIQSLDIEGEVKEREVKRRNKDQNDGEGDITLINVQI